MLVFISIKHSKSPEKIQSIARLFLFIKGHRNSRFRVERRTIYSSKQFRIHCRKRGKKWAFMNIKRKYVSKLPSAEKKLSLLEEWTQRVSTMVTITVRKWYQTTKLDNELSTPFTSLISRGLFAPLNFKVFSYHKLEDYKELYVV